MAEPARQLDEEPIYDQESTEPSEPKLNLRSLEGGGETTEPKKGHLKSADSLGATSEELAEKEGAAVETLAEPVYENPVGRGYRKGNASKSVWSKYTQNRRRAILVGGGVAMLIAGIGIALFLALLPLKILHIVSNLQNRFYATSENAVQKETDQLFSHYIRNGLRSCKGTINKSCNPIPLTSNPVNRLYRGWQNARLEDKISSKYGIEFGYSNGNYLMKAPGLSGNGITINEFVNSNTGESLDDFLARSTSADFTKANRAQIRQTVRDALSTETRWKGVMYRFKVGRLLEEKYGIRRCIVFCGVTDPLADSIDSQKKAAKLFIAERVIQPRGEMLGIALACLFDDNCTPTDTTVVPCETNVDCELNGAPENVQSDTRIRTSLDSLAAQYGVEDVDALKSIYTQISDKGMQQYFIEKALAGIIGDTEAAKLTAENLSKAIPIVGWINLASNVVILGSTANSKVKKLDYAVNAGSAVQLYSMYRTYADEVKSGKVKSTEVGSFNSSLFGGDQTGGTGDKQLGGTAEAESTPLYSNLIGSGSKPTTTSFIDQLLPQQAFAATTPAYLCNDGKPVPAGSLICKEEKLGVGNAYTKDLSDIFNSPEMKPLVAAANLWKQTGGKIVSTLGSILGGLLKYIPGYSSVEDLVAKLVSPLMKLVINYLIPSPFAENMSGGRTFDMMAAGADVSGNDYAHNGIGGQTLSSQQVADIVNQQSQQELQQYKNESLFARMFDTQSKYSPATKLAMAMPSSFNDLVSSLHNPLGSVFSNFGSIFGVETGQAAAIAPSVDVFGVTQYGYPVNDPSLAEANKDPQAYWDTHCADGSQTLQWNQTAADPSNINDTTGMPTNTTTNPCLLIQAATGSDGAVYDSSLLTADELGAGGTDTTALVPSPVSGNAQQLAKQILNNPNIQLTGRLVLEDIQAAANNQAGTAGVKTSAAILQLIATIGNSHSVTISAIQSGGTGHCNNTPKSACPDDPHYTGDAVDFSALDGTALSGRDSGSLVIMKIAFTVLPTGSGFGQKQCGTTPPLPSGDITFEDTCNHLHVQVPQGTP